MITLSSTFSHHTTEANGVKLHYVIGGSGEPILLWHGFLETWYCWRKIMPALAERYTVIVPDMRGYGDSDKPETGYDARSLSEDFRQLIQQLGFEKIHIVAHDMGAPPALIYTNDYPDEVLSLTYLEEPVLLQAHLQQIFQFSPQSTQNGGLWWWTFFLAPELPETLIAGREQEFLSYFYKTYCVDSSAIEPEAINEYLRTFATPAGIRGALGVYRAIFESVQQTEAIANHPIQTPVLALGGEKSIGEKVKLMMQSVATDVRGGSVDRCGHFIPDERPDALIDQLFTFFQSVENKRLRGVV
ncbi:alpha/beta fold hydrolase [Leptolyngbya sp. NIES-2104]|uniref:alpha/beta fold hydrolase n=1 Tax=Leptolyngbya sp. NIES-2104 TaxID=1552121 RepID=UPI0006EC86A5|nr:alpha/beta hydrolase [Leptolyngbya sp. NIES-2104]GAP98022.1 epoxide hydrolase [Leptolyngbya sp. NIES-2104]